MRLRLSLLELGTITVALNGSAGSSGLVFVIEFYVGAAACPDMPLDSKSNVPKTTKMGLGSLGEFRQVPMHNSRNLHRD